mmetsp:Transcript_120955/g.342174  ORF Transcript_120955/g.342174 Transcript_120955/m.342174 type:complete len:273 (+) Transcript_120955:1241-2059(+)
MGLRHGLNVNRSEAAVQCAVQGEAHLEAGHVSSAVLFEIKSLSEAWRVDQAHALCLVIYRHDADQPGRLWRRAGHVRLVRLMRLRRKTRSSSGRRKHTLELQVVRPELAVREDLDVEMDRLPREVHTRKVRWDLPGVKAGVVLQASAIDETIPILLAKRLDGPDVLRATAAPGPDGAGNAAATMHGQIGDPGHAGEPRMRQLKCACHDPRSIVAVHLELVARGNSFQVVWVDVRRQVGSEEEDVGLLRRCPFGRDEAKALGCVKNLDGARLQ